MTRSKSGFTLIEVLVVCVVIVILALISYVAYMGYQREARDNDRQSNIANIASALQTYYLQNNEYPDVNNAAFFNPLTAKGYVDPLDKPSWTYQRNMNTGLCTINGIRWGGGEGQTYSSCRNYGYISGFDASGVSDDGTSGPGCSINGTAGEVWYALSYYSEQTKTIIFVGSPAAHISQSAPSQAFPGERCEFSTTN